MTTYHRIIDEHPAVRRIAEERRRHAEAQAKLQQDVLRREREHSERHAAWVQECQRLAQAGQSVKMPDPPQRNPEVFEQLRQAQQALTHRSSTLRDEERQVLRENAAQLTKALTRRETELLEEAGRLLEPLQGIAGELDRLVAGVRAIRAATHPGQPSGLPDDVTVETLVRALSRGKTLTDPAPTPNGATNLHRVARVVG